MSIAPTSAYGGGTGPPRPRPPPGSLPIPPTDSLLSALRYVQQHLATVAAAAHEPPRTLITTPSPETSPPALELIQACAALINCVLQLPQQAQPLALGHHTIDSVHYPHTNTNIQRALTPTSSLKNPTTVQTSQNITASRPSRSHSPKPAAVTRTDSTDDRSSFAPLSSSFTEPVCIS